jgi:hypothetical protein
VRLLWCDLCVADSSKIGGCVLTFQRGGGCLVQMQIFSCTELCEVRCSGVASVIRHDGSAHAHMLWECKLNWLCAAFLLMLQLAVMNKPTSCC